MIEGSVEDTLLLLILRLHVYLGKPSIPCTTRLLPDAVKVPPWDFVQILARTLGIDRRKSHLDQHLLVLPSLELQQRLATSGCHLPILLLHRISDNRTRERLGEDGVEVFILLPCPSASILVTTQGGIVYLLKRQGTVALVQELDAVVQVEDKASILAFGEGVAVQGCTLGGSQLRLHAISVQKYGIIAGRSTLLIVRERRGIGQDLLVARLSFQLLLTHRRHQQDVAIIATSRAAKVSVRETVNGTIRVVIARTSIPLLETCVRARMNHSIGHNGTRIGMTVAACTDERIDILGVVFLHRSRATSGQSHGKYT